MGLEETITGDAGAVIPAQALLDALPDAAAVLDGAGCVTAVNPAWRRIGTPFEASEMGPGFNYLGHLRSLAREGVEQAARFVEAIHCVLHEERDRMELICAAPSPEGEVFFSLCVHTLEEAGGSVLVTCRPLPLRHPVEPAFRHVELRYRKIVEQLPGIAYIAEFGPSGRWHYVSPQVRSLLGFSEEDWLADPHLWFQQICEEDRDRVISEEISTAETGRFVCEYRMRTNDDRVLWFHDEGTLLDAESGGTPVLLGVMLDISGKKEAEEHLRLREAQLLQSQKVDALGRLAGGIAHDFNNLLTSIMGFSQLLLDSLPENSESRADAEAILESSERGARLTRQLLALGRKSSGTAQLVDVNHLVADMERILRRTLGEDIELTTRLAPEDAFVRADPDLLQQVIMNLALNARDAMPRGGSLLIETSVAAEPADLMPAGDYVAIRVQDNGTGMTPEVKKQIFEPFFTTKERGKGSGLGLASVYGITKQFKGHIEVDSAPAVGTTFRIYFPLASDWLAPPAPNPQTPTEPGGRETILVVEDEEAIRHLVAKSLRALGYSVQQASDGAEALSGIEAGALRPDAILTDVIMPRMSGPVLIQKLQERGIHLPYLFISGFVDERVASHGVAPTAPNLLKKPFKRADLAVRLRETLDRARPVATAP